MARFILRRLGFMVMTVLLASIIIFWATTVLPGDVASQILGRFATEEAKSELRTELGLDRPVVVQYGSWLGNYVQGDWGDSPSMNTLVRPIVFERLSNSLMLAVVAFVMYVPLGILLGLIAALAQEHLGGPDDLRRVARVHRPARVRQRPHPHRDLRHPAPAGSRRSRRSRRTQASSRRCRTSSCRRSRWR